MITTSHDLHVGPSVRISTKCCKQLCRKLSKTLAFKIHPTNQSHSSVFIPVFRFSLLTECWQVPQADTRACETPTITVPIACDTHTPADADAAARSWIPHGARTHPPSPPGQQQPGAQPIFQQTPAATQLPSDQHMSPKDTFRELSGYI